MAETSVPFKVVVLISGRGSNLRALVENQSAPGAAYRVVGVISDKANAAGLKYAQEKGIPVTVVPRLPKERSQADFNNALADTAQSFSPDLVVLAGFMRVLRAEFISRFPGRIINIHPSLLPAFPGLNVQQQAIDAGVKFSGCTVHFVTELVDAGKIIAQAVVPVLPGDTAEILATRILRQEHRLLPSVVAAIADGQIPLSTDVTDISHTQSGLLLVGDAEDAHLLSIKPIC